MPYFLFFANWELMCLVTKSMASTTLRAKQGPKDNRVAAAGSGGGLGGPPVVSTKAAVGSSAGQNQSPDKAKLRAIFARGVKNGVFKPVKIGDPVYNYDPKTKKTVWGTIRKR